MSDVLNKAIRQLEPLLEPEAVAWAKAMDKDQLLRIEGTLFSIAVSLKRLADEFAPRDEI